MNKKLTLEMEPSSTVENNVALSIKTGISKMSVCMGGLVSVRDIQSHLQK